MENMNNSSNKETNYVESEFIGKDDVVNEKATKDESKMSDAERMAQDFVDGMSSKLDEGAAMNEDRIDLEEVESKMYDLDNIKSRFDSMVSQSETHGNSITETIRISDLDADSENLLVDGLADINDLSNHRSWGERLVALIPSESVQKSMSERLHIASKVQSRNKNVKEFAEAYFDRIKSKQDEVDSNRGSIDEIRRKLVQSDEMAMVMLNEARSCVKYIEKEGGTKHDEIKAKQLVVSIGNQLAEQKTIQEQAELFESLASVISDQISDTLPQVREQFINQTAINASLGNLVDYKKGVDSAQLLLKKMQGQVLDKTTTVVAEFNKTGLGASKEMLEIEADNKKKAANLGSLKASLDENYRKSLNKQLDLVESRLDLKD